jgi:hypothetical protein
MANVDWKIEGEWFETCNCAYLCPCIVTHQKAQPTEGDCIVAGVYRIDEGRYGDVSLDGLNFVTVIRTPGPMAEGNWKVGAIIDERADEAQREALTAIVSGKAGGPPDRLNTVMGEFAGIEFAPISFELNGLTRAAAVPGYLDQAVEGMTGGRRPEEPIYLENVGHPAGPRLALAKAVRSHLSAFGLQWDNTSGTNNGHFTNFAWQN